MNPDFLWLVDIFELLAFFVIQPVIAIFIAIRVWNQKKSSQYSALYIRRSILTGILAISLFIFAKWIDADVRTPQFFLQVTCVIASFCLFGICEGYFFSILLGLWRKHNETKL